MTYCIDTNIYCGHDLLICGYIALTIFSALIQLNCGHELVSYNKSIT